MNQAVIVRPARLALLGGLVIASLLAGTALAADAGPQVVFKPDVGPDKSVAIFAGGCFWCMEQAFDPIKGVQATISGYTGGHVDNPTYGDVTSEDSGHTEALKVIYDPKTVTYDRLLQVFWHNVDPTDSSGQFCDRGDSYRSEIFAVGDNQIQTAEASKKALLADKSAPSPIVTKIVPAVTFYPAEAYHQDYYKKNPLRYKFYHNACRRDATLDKLWGNKARTPAR